jgi:hypothetical protein
MTDREEDELRRQYHQAMRDLEAEAAAWLDARAGGRSYIRNERALTEAERLTRRLERKAKRQGVAL